MFGYGSGKRALDLAFDDRQRGLVVDLFKPGDETVVLLLDDEVFFLIDFVLETPERLGLRISDNGEGLAETDLGQGIYRLGRREQLGKLVCVHPVPKDFARRIAFLDLAAEDFSLFGVLFDGIARIGLIDVGFLGVFLFALLFLHLFLFILFESVHGMFGRQGQQSFHVGNHVFERSGKGFGIITEPEKQREAEKDKAQGDDAP